MKELYKTIDSTVREAVKLADTLAFSDRATRLFRIAEDTLVYAVKHGKCSDAGLVDMLNIFPLDVDYVFDQLAVA